MLNEPRAGDIWSYWWSMDDRRYYLLIEQREKEYDSHRQDWHVMNLENGEMSLMGFDKHIERYWRRET